MVPWVGQSEKTGVIADSDSGVNPAMEYPALRMAAAAPRPGPPFNHAKDRHAGQHPEKARGQGGRPREGSRVGWPLRKGIQEWPSTVAAPLALHTPRIRLTARGNANWGGCSGGANPLVLVAIVP